MIDFICYFAERHRHGMAIFDQVQVCVCMCACVYAHRGKCVIFSTYTCAIAMSPVLTHYTCAFHITCSIYHIILISCTHKNILSIIYLLYKNHTCKNVIISLQNTSTHYIA